MLVTVFTTESEMYPIYCEAARILGQAKVNDHGRCIGSLGDSEMVACLSDRASNHFEIALITPGLGAFKNVALKENEHLRNIHQRGVFKPVLLSSEAQVETYNTLDRMVAFAMSLVTTPQYGDMFPGNIDVLSMTVALGETTTPVTILSLNYSTTVGTVVDTTYRPPKPIAARFYLDEGL